MALSLVTGPSQEPLDLDEVKLHLRVDHDEEDALIQGLIVAARERAETETGRALLSQTWDLILPAVPCSGIIEFPKPPLLTVDSVSYVDGSGVTQTWASSNYQYDIPAGLYAARGRLMPAYQVLWPSVRAGVFAGLTVRFTAGYGDAPDAVPQAIKQAMLLTIGEWYGPNRQNVNERLSTMASFPSAAASLLWSFCDRPIGVSA